MAFYLKKIEKCFIICVRFIILLYNKKKVSILELRNIIKQNKKEETNKKKEKEKKLRNLYEKL